MNNTNDLPQGFAMALAQNSDAFQRFIGLSNKEKQEYITKARNVTSKSQMQELVQSLTTGNIFKM